MIPQEHLSDFKLLFLALLALNLFPLLRKQKLDWRAVAMVAPFIMVVGHYLIAGYSDHTANGARLRLVAALAMSILGIWGAVESAWELTKTLGDGSFKRWVPLARTLLFGLGWLLRAIAYLVAPTQAWILAANASRRYLVNFNLTGSFPDALAAAGGALSRILGDILVVVGWPSLALAVLLLSAAWIRGKYLKGKKKRQAKKKPPTTP